MLRGGFGRLRLTATAVSFPPTISSLDCSSSLMVDQQGGKKDKGKQKARTPPAETTDGSGSEGESEEEEVLVWEAAQPGMRGNERCSQCQRRGLACLATDRKGSATQCLNCTLRKGAGCEVRPPLLFLSLPCPQVPEGRGTNVLHEQNNFYQPQEGLYHWPPDNTLIVPPKTTQGLMDWQQRGRVGVFRRDGRHILSTLDHPSGDKNLVRKQVDYERNHPPQPLSSDHSSLESDPPATGDPWRSAWLKRPKRREEVEAGRWKSFSGEGEQGRSARRKRMRKREKADPKRVRMLRKERERARVRFFTLLFFCFPPFATRLSARRLTPSRSADGQHQPATPQPRHSQAEG